MRLHFYISSSKHKTISLSHVSSTALSSTLSLLLFTLIYTGRFATLSLCRHNEVIARLSDVNATSVVKLFNLIELPYYNPIRIRYFEIQTVFNRGKKKRKSLVLFRFFYNKKCPRLLFFI